MPVRNKSRFWQDWSTIDFARADLGRTIALLPVAATEQHGPHLPVSVDARINAALVARTLERLPGKFPILVLPMQHVGVSPEHGDFPGTLSVSAETMIRLMTEIGQGVAAAGIGRLVLFNSHGGQPQILDIVAQRLRAERNLLTFPINAYRFWRAEDHFPAEEGQHGIHAGAVETSIMLHIDAGQVRRGAIKNFPSLSRAMAKKYKHLRPFGRTGSFGWQMQDLNRDGAAGDARLATAAIGRKLIDQAASQIAELLQEIAAMPQVLPAKGRRRRTRS
ncbi:MAG: creatininase family protein [Alphaproteobacteria bacterium]